ncbi:DUF2569 family protein [Chitinophaga sedimenti]|uniref:DUF2569 family protein n=1 Tax=Chitinophaga sedimenti TaxID=2033606 RepID=UPI002002BEFF|nr:DUF2569 family protein [Chitinophaga sedimenti]MCK7558747.1 DUF2569 family protein [Chitinophaga sedimenti]
MVNWAMKINRTSGAGIHLAEKIAELKRGAGNDTMRYILDAIRFVQDDIRYPGIEMGENSHRPNEPDRVLAQRFGDCKDKSLLLITLLKARGVSASMAYVNTVMEGDIIELKPSPYAFDHAIVAIDYHEKTYWIDPTIAYQRGPLASRGSLPYGRALLIRDGSLGLAPVKGGETGKIKVWEKFRLSTENDGSTTLDVRTEYTGSFADDVRSEFALYSMASREESFRSYYDDTYLGVMVTDSLTTKDREDNNIYEVLEHYKIIQAWMYDTLMRNGSLMFTSNVKMLADQIPGITTELNGSTASLKYPYNMEYEVELHMPVSWGNAPAPVHLRTQYYRFDFEPSVEGKVVRLRYRYETYSSQVPSDAMADYRADVRQMASTVSLLFTFNPHGAVYDGRSYGGGWNWLMVALGGLFTLGFTALAVLYSRRSVWPLKPRVQVWQINGWLIVLGIGLVFRPFYLLLALMNMDAFFYGAWEQTMLLSPGNGSTRWQLGLVALLLSQVMLTVYAILLCVLFFRRRDIFPRSLITFYLLEIAVLAVIHMLPEELRQHQTLAINYVTEAIVVISAAIWIPYMVFSERARNTFVLPHSSLVSYEPPEVPAAPSYSPLTEGVVPAKPYFEGRVRETGRIWADGLPEMNEESHQPEEGTVTAAEAGREAIPDQAAADELVETEQPATAPAVKEYSAADELTETEQPASVPAMNAADDLLETIAASGQSNGSIPAITEYRAADDLLETIRAGRQSNGSVPEITKYRAANDLMDTIKTNESAVDDSETDQSHQPEEKTAADNILETLRAMKFDAMYTSTEPEPEEKTAEPDDAPDSAADNILATIRFLHSMKNQDGNPLHGQNILLLNEKEKPGESTGQ